MWVRVAAALFLLFLPTAVFAQSEKRIALLIGNRAYDASVGVLKNPHNDIALVGEALAKQGFEVLPPITDARRSAILGAVRELVRRLNTAGAGAVGFFYYSGHGAAEKDTNVNYLIPVDAKDPGSSTFWDDSLKLDDVLKLLDAARSSAKFVIFDACRNELQLPTKDTTKGLVPVAEQQGMFIAYASAPGRTASDRGDKSGPYARALAAELGRPGVDHLSLFQNVKEAVYAASGGAQQPWESNGLVRRVYLTGQLAPPHQANVPVTSPRTSEAAEAWSIIKDATALPALEAYSARFKDTFYAELARQRIAELKKQQLSATPPQSARIETIDATRERGRVEAPRAGPDERKAEQPALGDRIAIAAPIIAAPGAGKRFSLEIGKSVELTQRGIILSVRDPDLQRNSIGVRIKGRGSRWGVGQEFPLAPYEGGSCRLGLLEVRADAAAFLLRC
jgi:uncharacterized caspase-like protein